MDSISATSASELARALGTSVPRVVRAAERLGMAGSRRSGGQLALDAGEVRRLREELGATPAIEGLSPTEVKVLAALRRAPLGLASARAVAARASISPTAASRSLKALERSGLAKRNEATLAAGRARRSELWRANLLHPRWSELAPELDRVRPRSSTRQRERRVPPRLGHLFWNAAPSQLEVRRAGPFIARRLLRAQDPEGLAWGAAHLRGSDWRGAARARGLDPGARALAENLARAAGHW